MTKAIYGTMKRDVSEGLTTIVAGERVRLTPLGDPQLSGGMWHAQPATWGLPIDDGLTVLAEDVLIDKPTDDDTGPLNRLARDAGIRGDAPTPQQALQQCVEALSMVPIPPGSDHRPYVIDALEAACAATGERFDRDAFTDDKAGG